MFSLTSLGLLTLGSASQPITYSQQIPQTVALKPDINAESTKLNPLSETECSRWRPNAGRHNWQPQLDANEVETVSASVQKGIN